MEVVEEAIEKAVLDGSTPGAVLLAETLDGSFKYSKAIGVKNLKTKEPMTIDTAMAIASCTKLLTTICILQLFQAGVLTPETDVLPRLPELAALKIFTGFDNAGKPKLRERVATITVRQLITHTMGGAYVFASPMLMKYYGANPPPEDSVPNRAATPLVEEPGTGWTYSHGLDWAGLLLERLTGMDLDSYMRKNIWIPLGLRDDEIGFWPKKHPGLQARRAALALRRDPSAQLRFLGRDPINDPSTAAFGGHGLFAILPAYMKILRSIADPEDERLLKKHWTEEMFKPQIGKQSEDRLNTIFGDPMQRDVFVGELPTDGVRYTWGYGGVLNLSKGEGWRSKGTLLWSGYYNLLWYIDRAAGLCIMYGSQVSPPGDAPIRKLMSAFEKAVYERIARDRAEATERHLHGNKI